MSIFCIGFYRALVPEFPGQIPCWLLPNAHVLESPFTPSCPLRRSDQIRRVDVGGEIINVVRASDVWTVTALGMNSIRLEVERGGDKLWIDLPSQFPTAAFRLIQASLAVILAGCLIGLPLILLWRSTSSAAPPLATFYAAIATLVATALSAQKSELANQIAMLSLLVAPAALWHLALTFPRERAILLSVPGVRMLPYASALLLAPVGVLALGEDPILWPLFSHLVMGATLGAWAVLILSSIYALGEADSAQELARARLMLFGSLLAPLLPSAAFAAMTHDFLDSAVFYFWVLPIARPIPIGLAISRYNLFDLEANIRVFIARMLYLGLSALTFSLVLAGALGLAGAPGILRELPVTVLISLVGVLALEPLRSRLPNIVENTLAPQIQKLRDLHEGLGEDLATLQGADAVGRRIAEDLKSGLAGCSGSVLLSQDRIWRPAHFFGEKPPNDPELAFEAVSLVESVPLVHLPATFSEDRHKTALDRAGVEVVAAIRSGSELHGLLLVGSSGCRKPYSWVELEFISRISTLAGIALHNARLSEELVAAEEKAAVGRVALGVAHDVGKELGWMHRLAHRLPSRLDDPQRLQRDARMLADLAKDTLEGLRRFVEESAQHANFSGPESESSRQSLDAVIARAVRQVGTEHGPLRVSVVLDPASSRTLCRPDFGRALFNLLDNAVHASPENQMVRLFATGETPQCVRVEIEDRGPGIPQQELDRVFEAGFTTRSEQGGSGIGLTVAREILRALGGSIKLGPALPCGTLATVLLPIGPGSKANS
jgi:signal transduction histidine kinase